MSGLQLSLPASRLGIFWTSGHSLPGFIDNLFWSHSSTRIWNVRLQTHPKGFCVCAGIVEYGKSGSSVWHFSHSNRGDRLCLTTFASTTPTRQWMKRRIGNLFRKIISLSKILLATLFCFLSQCTCFSLPLLIGIIKLKIQACPIEACLYGQCYVN